MSAVRIILFDLLKECSVQSVRFGFQYKLFFARRCHSAITVVAVVVTIRPCNLAKGNTFRTFYNFNVYVLYIIHKKHCAEAKKIKKIYLCHGHIIIKAHIYL